MSVASIFMDFLVDAVEKHSDTFDEVLWAKVDNVVTSQGIVQDVIDVTIRENVDGPTAVKTYRVTVKEINP